MIHLIGAYISDDGNGSEMESVVTGSMEGDGNLLAIASGIAAVPYTLMRAYHKDHHPTVSTVHICFQLFEPRHSFLSATVVLALYVAV